MSEFDLPSTVICLRILEWYSLSEFLSHKKPFWGTSNFLVLKSGIKNLTTLINDWVLDDKVWGEKWNWVLDVGSHGENVTSEQTDRTAPVFLLDIKYSAFTKMLALYVWDMFFYFFFQKSYDRIWKYKRSLPVVSKNTGTILFEWEDLANIQIGFR